MEAKVERILRLVNFKDGTPWGAGGGEGICRTCPADSNKSEYNMREISSPSQWNGRRKGIVSHSSHHSPALSAHIPFCPHLRVLHITQEFSYQYG